MNKFAGKKRFSGSKNERFDKKKRTKRKYDDRGESPRSERDQHSGYGAPKKRFKSKSEDGEREKLSERKRSFLRGSDDERKPRFNKDKKFGDKPFKKRFDDRGSDGERKPFKKRFDDKDGDSKPRFNRDKKFGDKPFKKRFDDRGGDGERKLFKKRFDDRDGDRKPRFDSDKKFGDKPFKKRFDDRGGDGEHKPFKKRFDDRDGDRKPRFDSDKKFGDKPFKKRFDDRGGDGERKPFKKRFDDRDGDRKPRFDSDKKFGDKPFKKRFDDREGGEERKPRFDSERKFGDKPFKKRFDDREGSGERKPYDRDKKFSKWGDKKKSYKKPHRKGDATEEVKKDDGTIRLNRYLANAGISSRREADTLIETGAVTVNGKIITEMGFKVKPDDEVRFSGAPVKREENVYILLNKPKDYITTVDDPDQRRTVMELIAGACNERVYPVGRLDRSTTGLLLFTNDGDLTKKLTHPKYGIKKVYHVELDMSLKPSDFEKISHGIELEDGFIKPDEISYVGANKREIGIELHSGKNRIVRRIFEQLGYNVRKLDRVFFAGLTKKDLPRGRWRFLSEKEIGFLKMIQS